MSPSIFLDKANKPSDQDLAAGLGKAKPLWDELIEHFREQTDNAAEEWKGYGGKTGWIFKLLHKKRTILYLIPQSGDFVASFALSDKAVAAALAAKLPDPLKNEIREAKKYPEGKPARVTVKSKRDLSAVKQLIRIKLEN